MRHSSGNVVSKIDLAMTFQRIQLASVPGVPCTSHWLEDVLIPGTGNFSVAGTWACTNTGDRADRISSD